MSVTPGFSVGTNKEVNLEVPITRKIPIRFAELQAKHPPAASYSAVDDNARQYIKAAFTLSGFLTHVFYDAR